MAYLLGEEHTPSAQAFFDGLDEEVDQLFGPGLLLAECTSIIREKTHNKIISEIEASDALEIALSLNVTTVIDVEHHRLALAYSSRRGSKKAYDEHYIAAAALTGAQLITIDSGMYQGAVDFKIPARLLR